MANWDQDSPQLHANLARVRKLLATAARDPEVPTIALAREWHEVMMDGLDVPDVPGMPEITRANSVGQFRGAVLPVDVGVGKHAGTRWQDVAVELEAFDSTLQAVCKALDERYPGGAALDEDGLAAVIDVAAWAHAEWVPNPSVPERQWPHGTAVGKSDLRPLRNPPVVTLRPRPGGAYGAAGAAAMKRQRQPTIALFRKLVEEELAKN